MEQIEGNQLDKNERLVNIGLGKNQTSIYKK